MPGSAGIGAYIAIVGSAFNDLAEDSIVNRNDRATSPVLGLRRFEREVLLLLVVAHRELVGAPSLVGVVKGPRGPRKSDANCCGMRRW